MKTIVFLLLSVLIMTSCGRKSKTTVVSDLEGVNCWINSQTLVSNQAHSGTTSSKIDSVNKFSFAYCKKVKDFPIKTCKKIKYSAWVYFDNLPKDAIIVVSVLRKDSFWVGEKISQKATEVKKWQKVSIVSTLPSDLSPEDELRVYVATTGNDVVYVDDFEISYEK